MKPNNYPQFQTSIISSELLTPTLLTLTLSCPESFNWSAGDYLWLGADSESLKPFSIANLPNSNHILCHIALNNDMDLWLKKLQSTSTVFIHGPVSQYTWPESDGTILLAAGGTGITPLMNLLMAHEEALLSRKVILYWGVKDLSSAFLDKHCHQLKVLYPLFDYHLVLSEMNSEWHGLIGLLPTILEQNSVLSEVSDCLICGPWPMVTAIKKQALNYMTIQHIQH